MVKSSSDLVTGIMFLLIGGGAAGIAGTYAMGSASRIGPGFFPFWLGLVLAAMGVGLVIQSVARKTGQASRLSWDWLTLFKVLVPVAIFAAMLSTLGLVLSLLLLVLLSSFASHEFNLRIALLNAVAICIGSIVLFVVILGLHLPVWPDFSRFF